MLCKKSYYIKLRRLLNHKIIFNEHIVCVFPENIISRFDVAVNDVAKEFAEMLRMLILVTVYKLFQSRYNISSNIINAREK